MKQQRGLTRAKVIIIAFVVFAVVVVVWSVILVLTKKDPPAPTRQTTQTQATPTPQPQPQASKDTGPTLEEDKAAVTLLAVNQCQNQFGGKWMDWLFPQDLEVSADQQFAHGLAGCAPRDNPAATVDTAKIMLFKKIDGKKWDVIYRGTNPPCADFADKWGVPKDWVAISESFDSANPTLCGS